MYKKSTRILFILILFFVPFRLLAQQTSRIQAIQRKLDSLGRSLPGLNQKVSLQVNGSVQQYLMGISSSNGLSISVDPKLLFNINDNLTDVTATNILVFLAQKYNLDVSVIGSIIYVSQYQDPAQFIKPPVKDINASYNAANGTLSFSLNNDSLTRVAKKCLTFRNTNGIN